MKKDWTEQMREQLADYEVRPTDDVWQAVSSGLPRARRRPLWRRWAVAASLLVLVGGGAYVAFRPAQDSEMLAESQEPNVEKLTVSQAPNVETLAMSEEPLSSKGEAGRESYDSKASVHTAPDASANAFLAEMIETPPLPLDGRGMEAQPSPSDVTDSQPSTDESVSHQSSGEVVSEDPSVEGNQRKRRAVAPVRRFTVRHPLSVGLYAQSVGSSSAASPVLMSHTMMSTYNIAASRQAPAIRLAGYEERQHHSMPLSVALKVGWSIAPRWTLSAGVAYTMLHSELETLVPSGTVVRDQRLHYVGLPVEVSYQLWSHRRWHVYAAAGAQMDCNVAIRVATGGVRQQASRDDVRFSASLSAGIGYTVVPGLSLFAEPSLRYHFDNGAPLSSYFTEHPLGGTLQAGVRWVPSGR